MLEDQADGVELGGRKAGHPLLEPLVVRCDHSLRLEREVVSDTAERGFPRPWVGQRSDDRIAEGVCFVPVESESAIRSSPG
jgi:hypothetical protein